ncbi:MAG: hypothetical protein WDW38_004881 [Sanguina aurantia]
MNETVTFDSAMTRLKKLVYKQRIRLKDFFVDFDKLHTGFVATNHFITALSMAGIDKHLSSSELETLRDAYKQTKGPSLILADYRSFLADVDIIFTVPNLETAPLTEVPREPVELLDKTRYFKASRVLAGVGENIAIDVIARLADIIARRGTPVKPFFDDAASNDHSAKMYGHVTVPQFRQCLGTKLDLLVTEKEVMLLVGKFCHEDKPEFVNYISFSNTIDPPEKW